MANTQDGKLTAVGKRQDLKILKVGRKLSVRESKEDTRSREQEARNAS